MHKGFFTYAYLPFICFLTSCVTQFDLSSFLGFHQICPYICVMPKLHITTVINAPIQRVFDLSRCVSLHKRQFETHKIMPVHGKTSGVMDLHDHIAWKGKVGKKTRHLFQIITKYESPDFYRDEIRKGFFEFFHHDHYFKDIDNGTIMIDQIEYQLPPGIINNLFNKTCTERNVSRLLKERIKMIKEFAEGNKWQAILP